MAFVKKTSKHGGTPDLLQYKSPTVASGKHTGYPRCEWYYLEDQAAADKGQKVQTQVVDKDYQFTLPDYMVYEANNVAPPNLSLGKKQRTPFAFDDTSPFEREGGEIRNKNNQLPEDRQQGYGIGQEKLKNSHASVKPLTTETPNSSHRRRKGFTNTGSSEPIEMDRILSHGYMEDLEKGRQQSAQKTNQSANLSTLGKMDFHTEYSDCVGKAQKSGKPRSACEPSSIEAAAAARRMSREAESKKTPFKIGQFTTVDQQSTTDSHRRSKGKGSVVRSNNDRLTAPFATEQPNGAYEQHMGSYSYPHPLEAVY